VRTTTFGIKDNGALIALAMQRFQRSAIANLQKLGDLFMSEDILETPTKRLSGDVKMGTGGKRHTTAS
jgi:hypothetical protein